MDSLQAKLEAVAAAQRARINNGRSLSKPGVTDNEMDDLMSQFSDLSSEPSSRASSRAPSSRAPSSNPTSRSGSNPTLASTRSSNNLSTPALERQASALGSRQLIVPRPSRPMYYTKTPEKYVNRYQREAIESRYRVDREGEITAANPPAPGEIVDLNNTRKGRQANRQEGRMLKALWDAGAEDRAKREAERAEREEKMKKREVEKQEKAARRERALSGTKYDPKRKSWQMN